MDRPLKPEDVLLEAEIVELHRRGYSLENIGKRLKPPISKQAVGKRLKKLKAPH